MQVVLAFEQAVVCHLRKDFFYSTTVAIKGGVVHFLCWQPTFGTVALDAVREWRAVEERAELPLGVLDGHVMYVLVCVRVCVLLWVSECNTRSKSNHTHHRPGSPISH